MSNTKICTGECGGELPATGEYFYEAKLGKFGFDARCKVCKKVYQADNKEARVVQRKARYEANKEAVAAQQQAYREANKEVIAAIGKAYREANKEVIAASQKAYIIAPAKHAIYAHKLTIDDYVVSSKGKLKVACTFCGQIFSPTNVMAQCRVAAIEGANTSMGTENRFYCGDECKEACRTRTDTILTKTPEQLVAINNGETPEPYSNRPAQCGRSYLNWMDMLVYAVAPLRSLKYTMNVAQL